MNLSEIITSAIVAMASLSLPVILGFLLYSTLNLRKDLDAGMQDLRKDLNKDMKDLRKDLTSDMKDLRKDLTSDMQDLRKDLTSDMQDLRKDVSTMNSRLGRIEGRLIGADAPAA